MSVKSIEVLEDFIVYCMTHPEERFWQAIRNWSGNNFVYVSQNKRALEDTFNFKGRDS